ncbi:hypothetical protein N780_17755 [Pontibacillus chungwhensis BH030062]|uniref:Glycosyltransferase n=1 Tax=Pontibacillus chungwhensis BH030062 TaxID=1385513 RepID=A0A0A2VBV4_9BACI|nr:hypothetical protein [Pontibacillus chungwhensis]KGP91150.1 hypothetical protein N780_17755 [Pontibacillus chungwhensis BH030062]
MGNEPKRNLIMGLISHYSWEDIKPFFLSLEKVNYSGEVVMFFEHINEETQNTLKNLNVNISLIPYERIGLEKTFDIIDYRHYLYLNFLRAHGHRYNKVLLTDVRDVFFQLNPFDAGWSDGSITVAKEELKIKDEYWNTKWILTKFGNHIYQQLENETIICAGTTYGPTELILAYLEEMVYHLFQLHYFPQIINDQAVHNYLIHSGKVQPVAYSDNEKGPIMTVAFEHNFHINHANQILLKSGAVAAIIHQYDRHEHLMNLIKEKVDE